MNNTSSYRTRFIILGVLLITFITLYCLGYTQYLSVEYLKQLSVYAKGFVNDYYWYTVGGFIGILTTAVALSLPLGIILPILGGFLFGFIPGALYAITAATMGASIAFLVARYLLGDFIQANFHERFVTFNKELKSYGALYLLGLHFFPITPFFILNILAALTPISFLIFFWTTVFGVMPAYFIYSYLGNHLTTIEHFSDLLSKELFFAFLFLKLLSASVLLWGRFGKKISWTKGH